MEKYDYRNTEIDWFNKIPKDWTIDRIKDKTTRVVGGDWGDDPDSDNEGNNVAVIRVADLDDIYFDLRDLTRRIISDTSLESRKINDRCLLIEKSGGGEKQKVGRVGYPAGLDETAICSNFMALLEFNKTVDIRFINYIFNYLYNSDVNYQYVQQTTGIQNLKLEYYLCTNVGFPACNEQKAIADFLDRACDKIDQVIAIKENQIHKIIEQRKSKVNEAIRFGLNENVTKQETGLDYFPEIKRGWEIDRFKDVASLRNDKTDEKSMDEDYLELEDIEQGTGKILNKRNTLEVASSVTKFYQGDVLFGKLRPYLEKYYLAEFDGKCTGEILAFQPRKIKGAYLKYLVGSKWFISLCNSMSYGAKMPRVNWSTQLSQVYLPLPTPQEQVDIVNYLDRLSSKTYKTVNNLREQIEVLSRYKTSLIYECVTGRKKVFKGESKGIKAEVA